MASSIALEQQLNKNYKTLEECIELVNRGVPEIYQAHDEFKVLQRFLAYSVKRIFESIEAIDYVYSPDFVEDRLLPILADTVGVEYPVGGRSERLRLLLKYYMKIMKVRGTEIAITHLSRILEMSEEEAYYEHLDNFNRIRITHEYWVDPDKYDEYKSAYDSYATAAAAGEFSVSQEEDIKIGLGELAERCKVYLGCLLIGTDYVSDFDYANKMLRHGVHAGFMYRLTNVDGYFRVENTENDNETMMKNVFNTWHRFSHGLNNAYPSIYYELGEWEYDIEKDVIRSTINSDSLIGFVSPVEFDRYEIGVKYSSSADDDDAMVFVIAFIEEDGREYTLSAVRGIGGVGVKWALVYNYRQADQKILVDQSIPDTTPLESVWKDFPYGCYIYCNRTPNSVYLKTSQVTNTNLDNDFDINFNLSMDIDTERFIQPCSYGFAVYSQPLAIFEPKEFPNQIKNATQNHFEWVKDKDYVLYMDKDEYLFHTFKFLENRWIDIIEFYSDSSAFVEKATVIEIEYEAESVGDTFPPLIG
jgi:hypothetical protein